MKPARKGLENIRTLRAMANRSMPISRGGALMERARLNREKERFCDEMEKLKRRMVVIVNRLGEIEQLERWLERFNEAPKSSPQHKGDGSAENREGKRSRREMILKY